MRVSYLTFRRARGGGGSGRVRMGMVGRHGDARAETGRARRTGAVRDDLVRRRRRVGGRAAAGGRGRRFSQRQRRRWATSPASASSSSAPAPRLHRPVRVDRARRARRPVHGARRRPTRSCTVTVDESLSTKLGAVAIDDEVWLSNPVTGTFEPLDAELRHRPRRVLRSRRTGGGRCSPSCEDVGARRRGGSRRQALPHPRHGAGRADAS